MGLLLAVPLPNIAGSLQLIATKKIFCVITFIIAYFACRKTDVQAPCNLSKQ